MQTYFEGEQASLFAPDTFAGRMFQAASAQARRTGRISGLSWRKLLDYIAPDYSVPRPLFGRWKPVGAIRVDDTFSLAWRVLAAEYWTLAQRRHRILLVADLGGSSAEKILFDYCGVSRNLAPGGGTWQAIAEGIRHCFADTSWLDWLDERQREKESK